MPGDKVQLFIGFSLIGIGLLEAIVGFYFDNLVLVGVGILLAVLNVAYVYEVGSGSE